MAVGGVVTARNPSGLATAFSATKTGWLPKINTYCGQWRLLLEMHGTKNWGMVVITDGEPLDAGAFTDTDIIMTPAPWTLETIITGAAYTTVQAGIATTDLTPAFFDGMTFRQMVAALTVALNTAPIPDSAFA